MRFLRHALPAALLATVLAACGDSTGPKAPENLPFQNGDVAAITAGVDSVYSQPVLALLRTGSAPMLRGSLQALTTAPAPTSPRLRGDLDASRARLAREVVVGEPVVPSILRGVTFIWNGTRWRVDTTAAGTPAPGAPSNGVRFALYARDNIGNPTGPILGYLTIIDNSTSSAARWTTRVATLAGLTVLESTNQMTAGPSGSSLSQSGYVTDGTRRVDQSLTLGPTSLKVTWSAPFAGLSMEASLSQGLSGLTLSYTFRTPKGTLRFLSTFTQQGGTAQIYVNGALWAKQSWDVNSDLSNDAWQKADGSGPITEADTAVLLDILDFFQAVNSLVDFQSAIDALLAGASTSA